MPVVTRRRRRLSASVATVSPVTSPETSNSRRAVYRRWPKPPYTYIGLIATAILCETGGRAPLSLIYQFFRQHFTFFSCSDYTGWKDSVRHMLSNKSCFTKVSRDPRRDNVKSNFWTVDVDQVDEFFLKRQNKDDTYAPYLHEQLGIPSIWELSGMTEEERQTVVHKLRSPTPSGENGKRKRQEQQASKEEQKEQTPRRKRTRKGKKSRKSSEDLDSQNNLSTTGTAQDNPQNILSATGTAQDIPQNILPTTETAQDIPQNILPITGMLQDLIITLIPASESNVLPPGESIVYYTPTDGRPVTILPPSVSPIKPSTPPPLVLPSSVKPGNSNCLSSAWDARVAPLSIEIPDDLDYIPDGWQQGEPLLMLDHGAIYSSSSPHSSHNQAYCDLRCQLKQAEVDCETGLELLADVALVLSSSHSSFTYSSFNSSGISQGEM